MYIDISQYRAKELQSSENDEDFDLFGDVSVGNQNETSKNKHDECVLFPCEGLFLPENENIEIISQSKISLPTKHIQLLSPSQLQQLQHGFLQYVPNTAEKFKIYWKYAYGIDISSDTMELTQIKDLYYERIVPSSSVIRFVFVLFMKVVIFEWLFDSAIEHWWKGKGMKRILSKEL